MILRPHLVPWTGALIAFGLLVAGFWPFAFFPRNRAAWVVGGRGLRFEPQALAYTPDIWLMRTAASNPDDAAPVTLELSLRAESAALRDCYPILTIDNGSLPANLVICEWHDKFLLRVPDVHAARGFREAGIDGLDEGRARVVAVTTDQSGAVFYLDGRLAERFPGFVVPSRAWRGRLVLGASSEGGPSWTGSTFGLALFDRVLAGDELAADVAAWTDDTASDMRRRPGLLALFPFSEGHGDVAADVVNPARKLLLPATYRSPHFQLLRLPSAKEPLRRPHLNDVLLNVAGFLPFGYVLFICFRRTTSEGWRRPLLLACAAGTAVSLLIEVVQAWLPGRDSSAVDLALNAIGSSAGALIALAGMAFRRDPEAPVPHAGTMPASSETERQPPP